ncbi:hypothetical protein K2Z84_29440 [Candidatus Binatia bacterium]|nr:hypothetical protein [Candidatus Binatia bacterium]
MRYMNETGFDLQLAGGSDPEGLVPAQWEERLRPPVVPELRLMAAVMIDAIRDYRNGARARSGRSRHLARLAARWIASRERAWPYSFESICAVFDIDADGLRHKLACERLQGIEAEQVRKRRNLVLTGPRPKVLRRHVATRQQPDHRQVA